MNPLNLVTVSDSFIRPNDTTQYAAGDGLSNDATSATPMTFSGTTLTDGGWGIIRGATLLQSAYSATPLDADLLLFTSSPTGTTFEDNAAAAVTDAQMADCVGIIFFDGSADGHAGTATAGTGGNLLQVKYDLRIPFRNVADSRDLYGIYIARSTYTPIAVEVFTTTLLIEQYS